MSEGDQPQGQESNDRTPASAEGDQESRRNIYVAVTAKLRAIEDIFLIQGNGLDLYLKRNFLLASECEHLISLIERDRQPSTVLGDQSDSSFRTSESSSLHDQKSPLISSINHRIWALSGIPSLFGEGLEGQRYVKGQQFKEHYDFFHIDQPYWPAQFRSGGQRSWTMVITLNQPEAGGGTLFPRAGVRMKPRAGNLLAWCNFNAHGDLNEMALHAGEPVEAGVKYILTKWHRERPFTPWAACTDGSN